MPSESLNARQVDSTAVHPATLDTERLLQQCELTFTRRGGPGGQHRNKVSTAVVLEHRLTSIRAEASERRSQAENRRVAIGRLRLKLALEVRSATPTKPSALWQSRLRGSRFEVSGSHEDFPPLLAEALDQIAAHHGDVPQAAAALHCTSSQLVKFLKLEPLALAQVNADRRARGMRPYA
jgi:hypothetical protein